MSLEAETAILSPEEVNVEARNLIPKLVDSLCIVPRFADSKIRAVIELSLAGTSTAQKIAEAQRHLDPRFKKVVVERNRTEWAIFYHGYNKGAIGMSVVQVQRTRLDRFAPRGIIFLQTTVEENSSSDGAKIKSGKDEDTVTAIAGVEDFIANF